MPSLLTSSANIVWPKLLPQPTVGSACISRPPLVLGFVASPSRGRLGESGEKLDSARALSQVFGARAAVVEALWLPSLLSVKLPVKLIQTRPAGLLLALAERGWAMASQPLLVPVVEPKDPYTWDCPKLLAGVELAGLLAAAREEALLNTSPLSMYLSCSGACSITAAVAMALLNVSTRLRLSALITPVLKLLPIALPVVLMSIAVELATAVVILLAFLKLNV